MRVAICMRGAVSKISNIPTGPFRKMNSLYVEGKYVNYQRCFNSIVNHILNTNPSYNFDFFCHCWNTDLQDNLNELYKPKKYLFEDNRKYNQEILSMCKKNDDFGQVSHALSMKKSIQLKDEYEEENKFKYDIVILYRYDVLLLKDMILDFYKIDNEKIYVNAHKKCNGDFHFVMKNLNSKFFKSLYDEIKNGKEPKIHGCIKQHILDNNKKLVIDSIIPGKHQAVIRNLYGDKFQRIPIKYLEKNII